MGKSLCVHASPGTTKEPIRLNYRIMLGVIDGVLNTALQPSLKTLILPPTKTWRDACEYRALP